MIDIDKIQSALKRQDIDAWLLYDFRRQNDIARDVLEVPDTTLTRRWFYLIPAEGEPVGIQHVMEPASVAHLPGRKIAYGNRTVLQEALTSVLKRCRTVAMEYSPQAALPTLSRVDQGTIELVQSHGARVVPSADLIQEFLAVLSQSAVDSHYRAAAQVMAIKDAAFARATDAVQSGTDITEYDLQQYILGELHRCGLEADHAPIVAVNAHAGLPHYEPTEAECAPIAADDLLLLDLWGREPGGVFADITWTGYLGAQVPSRIAEVFSVVAQARDAVVNAISEATADGSVITGAEADRAARTVIADAGYADKFIHRTGHSITNELHGPGANLDDYETEDVRPLMQGVLFSVEPGIYLSDFGIRSEINVLMTPDGPEVTTLPLQSEVLPLLKT